MLAMAKVPYEDKRFSFSFSHLIQVNLNPIQGFGTDQNVLLLLFPHPTIQLPKIALGLD